MLSAFHKERIQHRIDMFNSVSGEQHRLHQAWQAGLGLEVGIWLHGRLLACEWYISKTVSLQDSHKSAVPSLPREWSHPDGCSL